jgi:myb proto-oncogene protein
MSSKVGISSTSKVKFTLQQDQIIIKLVGNNPNPNWTEIAKQVPGKTGRQCRERWHQVLDPNVNSGPWTFAEDNLLYELHQKFPKDWVKIAEQMPHRTNLSVKNRFRSVTFKRERGGVALEKSVNKKEPSNGNDNNGNLVDFDSHQLELSFWGEEDNDELARWNWAVCSSDESE